MRGQGVSEAILGVFGMIFRRKRSKCPRRDRTRQHGFFQEQRDEEEWLFEQFLSSSKVDGGWGNTSESLKIFERSMMNAAQGARAKLSGHAAMCRVYFTKMSTELVYLMFEISWPFFYRCITMVLDEEESRNGRQRRKERENGGRLNSIESAAMMRPGHLELVACVLDLLRYSISACLCLGMETERRAFAALLAKFHFLHSNSGEWDSIGDVMVFAHEESSRDASSVSARASSNGQTSIRGTGHSSRVSSCQESILSRRGSNTLCRHRLTTQRRSWMSLVKCTSSPHACETASCWSTSQGRLCGCTLRFVRKDVSTIRAFRDKGPASDQRGNPYSAHTNRQVETIPRCFFRPPSLCKRWRSQQV